MIFLDTGYFKALNDEKDPNHKASLKIRDYIKEQKEKTVINTTVIVETLNRVNGSYDIVKKVYDDLREKNKVIELTGEDYEKSLDVSAWFGNSINYSDCTILNTMMNMGIDTIVSFDGDFRNIDFLEVIFAM